MCSIYMKNSIWIWHFDCDRRKKMCIIHKYWSTTLAKSPVSPRLEDSWMLFSHNRQKLLYRKTFRLFRDQEKKIPTSKQFPNTDFHIPCVMAWFGSLNCMKICLAQNKLNVVLTRFFFHLWEVGFFVAFEQENNIWHFSRTVFKCHLWNCEWAILIEADVTLPSLI